MRRKVLIPAIMALLALGGCAQNDAGLTRAKVTWCGQQLCSAEIIDGKEKASVGLRVIFPDGSLVEYAADEVKAFRAHEIRAAVDSALIETTGKVVPEIAAAITKAVLGIGALDAVTGAVGANAALEGAKLKAEAAKAAAAAQPRKP